MKQRGFLQTSSIFLKELESQNSTLPQFDSYKVDKRKTDLFLPLDPMENFTVKFLGPIYSGIKERVSGVSNLETELHKIVLEYNEYGWRELHFIVLDYFCEKYKLDVDIVHHECEIMKKVPPFVSLQAFRTILSGNWEQPKPRRVPKSRVIKNDNDWGVCG
jgi:hypothetical protein